MVDNPEEAGLFAGVADAVLINLGTPTAAQVEVDAARGGGRPEGGQTLGPRPDRRRRPAVARRGRGGASAVQAGDRARQRVRDHRPRGLRRRREGVDSSADPAAAVPAAVDLLAHAAAVSASGPVDHAVGLVGGRATLVRIGGGSELLTRVTATGCALGALAAAYASVAPDALTGLVAAHMHFAVAAEIAAASAKGPGSFLVAFVDALDAVDEAALRRLARIEPPVALG